jgi:hypothetical protein
MIINNKFRPPVELLEIPPLKKTHDFYKTTGNLWDSEYLTSKKVSKYYHDIHNSYLTGPKSPYLLSLQDSVERSKANSVKAQIRIKEAHELLQRRKQERLKHQARSASQDGENVQNRGNEKAVTPLNAWTRLNHVPVSTLKHVIPREVIEKDRQAIESIMNKTLELEKMKNWHKAQLQSNWLKDRLATINRHNAQKELENRCGIRKVRETGSVEGTFGYVKNHRIRERTELLSKPRTAVKGSEFDHEDFRGLLHADYEEAVRKMTAVGSPRATKRSNNSEKTRQQKAETSENHIKITEDIVEDGSGSSSIEVMNLDPLKNPFK